MKKFIRCYLYDNDLEILEITFVTGLVRKYFGVRYSRYLGFSKAVDKDKYWQSYINTHYQFEDKLPD